MPELTSKRRAQRVFGTSGAVIKSEDVLPEKNNAQKWTVAIGEQIQKKSVHENVQYIPLSSVILDPMNTRSFVLDRDEIQKAPKPIRQNSLCIYDDSFESMVQQYFIGREDAGDCIDEYLSLSKLACSINSAKTLINPIAVIQEDMNFKVIAGHRRVLAHEILDEELILARIMPSAMSSLDKLLLQWRENEDREDLRLFDMLEAVSRICEVLDLEAESPLSIRDFAKVLGMSKSKLGRYLKIIRLYKRNDLLRQAIDDNKFKTVNDIYSLVQIPSEHEQKKILNSMTDAKNMFSSEQIKLAIDKNKQTSHDNKSEKGKFSDDYIFFQKNIRKDIVKEMILSMGKTALFKDFNIEEFELNSLSDIQLVINAMYMHVDT